eukprot:TRINITY_DN449_c0_g2_i1.p1 TRINITY_DN449_c0_g2~~TRINITY_DN449_c0_g2_i1.p1  ORF type:complete len:146 (-),score=34.05 TRINITY_DN449_c0_g2_i1:141-518(-)
MGESLSKFANGEEPPGACKNLVGSWVRTNGHEGAHEWFQIHPAGKVIYKKRTEHSKVSSESGARHWKYDEATKHITFTVNFTTYNVVSIPPERSDTPRKLVIDDDGKLLEFVEGERPPELADEMK